MEKMDEQAKKKMDQRYTNLMKEAQRVRPVETYEEAPTESNFRGIDTGYLEIKKDTERRLD